MAGAAMVLEKTDEPPIGWRIRVTRNDHEVTGKAVVHLWASMFESAVVAESKVRAEVGAAFRTAEIIDSLDPTLVALLGLRPGDVKPL
jgi:hypothetical protein